MFLQLKMESLNHILLYIFHLLKSKKPYAFWHLQALNWLCRIHAMDVLVGMGQLAWPVSPTRAISASAKTGSEGNTVKICVSSNCLRISKYQWWYPFCIKCVNSMRHLHYRTCVTEPQIQASGFDSWPESPWGAGARHLTLTALPCPLLTMNVSFFPVATIRYFVADFAENCDDQCSKNSLRCLPEGFSGKNVTQLFHSLGFPCKNVTSYIFGDQPVYHVSEEDCLGAIGIPERIHCHYGHNWQMRRLCPCA